MSETQRTEVSARLMEEVRRVAREQGRSESDVMNEAVALFLALRQRFVRGGPVAEPAGSLKAFFEHVAKWQRERGVAPLSDEEAMELANEELHAMRRERRGR
ncbi:MAG: hypothetical protein ACRDSJ_15560 [Rubrobacteraceae bacterium]